MPSASALVIGAQGTFGIINGIYGLLPSGSAASAQLLSISSPAAVDAIALGSITIGCVEPQARPYPYAILNPKDPSYYIISSRVIIIQAYETDILGPST